MTAPTVKGRTRFITLADLDGRTRAARNARDIAAAMTADLGGEQDLTEAQRQLIQRAATLGALIEDFEARFPPANSWTISRNTYRQSRHNGTS